MEHRKAPTASSTTADSNNNNNSRQQRRTKKRARYASQNQRIPAIVITEGTPQHKKSSPPEQERRPMTSPLTWTKRWTKWLSSCRSDRQTHPRSTSMAIAIGVSWSSLFLWDTCWECDWSIMPHRYSLVPDRCSPSVLWWTISCQKDAIEYRQGTEASVVCLCV